MEVITSICPDMKLHNKNTECVVHTIHVKVKNIASFAGAMIDDFKDTSWIKNFGFDEINQAAFNATAKRTVDKLVNQILSKVQDEVTSDFGEYAVSYASRSVLISEKKHKFIPLAEFLKEKISGNPGFDFHVETTDEHIGYGEAKYSSTKSPYKDAIDQIISFIRDEKDIAELVILQKFVSNNAALNAVKGKKAFVIGFSLLSKKPEKIFENILRSKYIDDLLGFPEIYIVGVEIND